MSDPNRFLRGPFAPVEEEITAFDLPVTGRPPAGLNGRYLRNGPNPLGLEDPSYRFREGHWFLGPGMVHGVRLRDGKAEWYRNRWVRSRQQLDPRPVDPAQRRAPPAQTQTALVRKDSRAMSTMATKGSVSP
jgi:carotenoid cleavage dioxygenase-like enzyme